jgi:hypothetical protein
VPRKRAKPNFDWLSNRRTADRVIHLSERHRELLKRCELPAAAHAQVESLAHNYINSGQIPLPKEPEVKAALRALRKLVSDLRNGMSATDVWTIAQINVSYIRGGGQRSNNVFATVYAALAELESAINKTRTQRLSDADRLGRGLKRIFKETGVTFSLAKSSPAVQTASTILDMVRPSGIEVAKHVIRRAMRDKKASRSRVLRLQSILIVQRGDKKASPSRTVKPLSRR